MKKKENRKTKEIPKLEIHHFQSSSLFHFMRERVARILRKIRKVGLRMKRFCPTKSEVLDGTSE